MAGTSKQDVVDAADISPRQVSNTSGKRVKAIPFASGTTVVVREADFKSAGGFDHPEVTWDYRIDDFTVAVGPSLTQEAADFLTSKYPDSFVYVGE